MERMHFAGLKFRDLTKNKFLKLQILKKLSKILICFNKQIVSTDFDFPQFPWHCKKQFYIVQDCESSQSGYAWLDLLFLLAFPWYVSPAPAIQTARIIHCIHVEH